MNILKWFKKKEEERPMAQPITYTLGWEIHSKDGTIQTRKYEGVPSDQRNEISAIIAKETAEMHAVLNKATKDDTEFVDLQGNILRLNDVVRICVVNKTSSDTP